jgi:hypothetical protein
VGFGVAVLATCVVLSAAAFSSRAAAIPAASHPSISSPGEWTPIALAPQPSTPAVWMSPAARATVLWYREIGVTSTFTYDVVGLLPTGAVLGAPASIFGSSGWSSLSTNATLVSHGGSPLAIFDGIRTTSSSDPYSHGCVVGALGSTSVWSPQAWSLSASCYNPVPSATETKTGVLSAAWPGAPGLLYRVGVSPAIPASGADSTIARPMSTVFTTGEASDTAGSDNIYVAWTQGFSTPASASAFYVKDVSTAGPVLRVPGTGPNSVNNLNAYATLAIANTNTHPGVYTLACSNAPTCSLSLWHVGATAVLAVPRSMGAWAYELSAGPDGRLWIAWTNQSASPETISTVRTNKADTRFGPVETYKMPFCFEHPLLGISGGAYGRLDIALQCVNEKALKNEEFVTQSETGLSLTPVVTAITNTVAHKVKFFVSDAGDAVPGATVSVDGKNATTNALGTVTISFAKGTKPGTFPLTATAVNYFEAHGTFKVIP